MHTDTQNAAAVAPAATPTSYTLSLVAGRGVAGTLGDGGPAVLAQLDNPGGLAVDIARGIAVADASNRVRYTAFGSITTIAGSGAPAFGGDGGLGTDAQINNPNAVAIDAAGGILIADADNDRIRRLDRDGTIKTIAGGGLRPPRDDDSVPALEAELRFPLGVAVDRAGNVYIADAEHHLIRRVDPAGTMTTVAGLALSSGFAGDGGPATRALLNFPASVAVGRKGELFIADTRNNCIRHVGPKGKISTVAGQGDTFGSFGGDGGPATDANLNFPTAVLLDGENLLIADASNARVRCVDRNGIISTIAGGGTETPADGVPATSARLLAPTSIASDRAGGLIVGDEFGHRVWRLTPAGTVPPAGGLSDA
jgi:hypothetical protein